jgi:hypothetical protein
MSRFVTSFLVLFLVFFIAYIVVEVIRSRRWRRFLIQLAVVAAVIVILNLTTGFPQPKVHFGGSSVLLAVAVMFGCVLAGMIANLLYYSSERFSFRTLLKPFIVAPLVMAPVIGSLESAPRIETIQLLTLALLSFQNGFFWRSVLERKENA